MLCIISSGTENLNVVKLCQHLSIDYTIVLDSLFWPYQDKENTFLEERITTIIDYMSKQGATHFILSPSLELAYDLKLEAGSLLPLFTNYLTYCLNHSLVGKIGFVGGYSDICQIESCFQSLSKSYQPTEGQKNTKHFQQPLSKRTKDTSMRGYFSRLFSPRSMMINKIIKTDLRYFKDANVDTIIPLDYSYFNYEKTITSFFNQKKQKFHKRDILKEIFQKTIPQETLGTLKTLGTLQLYYTGSLHLISEHKKWEALLSQGGQKTIEYKKITL